MSPKFWYRTFRNLFFRRRPYFAHLAITHHCNLRCHFCHIPENRVPELDTDGIKRIIDRLDQLGVAVLSISGGGEPLLRRDFAVLLNYAAGKGMYTKITSNGTMPLAKYDALMASRVDEIAISLDGVRGSELPFGHVGPKILETIRYLNDHLPPGKKLTLNITISSSNRDQVRDIVEFCTREFTKARLWLNPVVVGQGKLRVSRELKVDPQYMREVDSPALLTPEFYRKGAEDYYRNETYDWGCMAGEMFFDIKPNGDFWICQDQPSESPLNILDPEFELKYRLADFNHRRECGGCTYSCYWITQKSFEPRNWPGMAEIWWKATTQPHEPCRQTAKAHGWVAGLAHFSWTRATIAARALAQTALWMLMLGALAGTPLGRAQTPPLEPEAVVARMEESNARRAGALQSYVSKRRYSASSSFLRRAATVVVEASFTAPDEKQFRVLERNGSKAVERRVFVPLMDTEKANARLPARSGVDISRRNYSFSYEGFDEGARAYTFRVDPRTSNKYLFRGRVWVNADDFAIQRIEGEPAQRPSFWVHKTSFVHEYAKFGDFWFPVQNRTEVELRLFGRSWMQIDYGDYDWQPREATAEAKPAASVPTNSATTGAASQPVSTASP